MKASSFRDILAQFLEEKDAKSTPPETRSEAHTQPFVEFAPLLEWQGRNLKQINKNAYASKPAPPQVPRPAPPPPLERVFALEKLPLMDQAQAQIMIHLGGNELNSGISQARVKRAHRRLAKQLHPDRTASSPEQFLLLQGAYESLRECLKRLEFSDSACGNESASASNSPRRAAA